MPKSSRLTPTPRSRAPGMVAAAWVGLARQHLLVDVEPQRLGRQAVPLERLADQVDQMAAEQVPGRQVDAHLDRHARLSTSGRSARAPCRSPARSARSSDATARPGPTKSAAASIPRRGCGQRASASMPMVCRSASRTLGWKYSSISPRMDGRAGRRAARAGRRSCGRTRGRTARSRCSAPWPRTWRRRRAASAGRSRSRRRGRSRSRRWPGSRTSSSPAALARRARPAAARRPPGPRLLP